MTESNNSQTGQGQNPAWNEFYEAIPENYREEVQPLIDPVLQKWDQGVQKRFESYKPFEKYVNDQVDPQAIDYAMGLLNTLNDNDGAMQVWEQLGSYLEKEGLLGQEEDEDDDEEEFDWNSLPAPLRKQIEQLQGGFSTLAEAQLMERQKQMDDADDAALDAELKNLKETYGEYDEDWVLAKMVNGMDAEEAVKSYHEWYDQALQARNRPKPFKALGSGSGEFPSGNGEFNPRKASSREITDMIAQRLMDVNRDR